MSTGNGNNASLISIVDKDSHVWNYDDLDVSGNEPPKLWGCGACPGLSV